MCCSIAFIVPIYVHTDLLIKYSVLLKEKSKSINKLSLTFAYMGTDEWFPGTEFVSPNIDLQRCMHVYKSRASAVDFTD